MWRWCFRLAVLAAGLLLPMTPARPQGVIQVFQPLGFAQIAAGGLASAVPLPSIPAGVRVAQICVEAQAVRWRDDGVAPTAAIGMPMAAGTCMLYSGSVTAISFIQVTAGALLDVSYYR